MEKKNIAYRIHFYNQESVYEIYASSLDESWMFGFVEVGGLYFKNSEDSTAQGEESSRLKLEFSGVDTTYIPVASIIRIDEVEVAQPSLGVVVKTKDNIRQFPQRKPFTVLDS